MRGYIFGAKSIAISTYRAVQALHGDFYIEGFLVTSLENNPHEIDGLPVKEVKTAAQRMTEQEKRRVRVWIAVPDDVQSQAKELLRRYGFMDFVPVDACMESRLLEQYYGQRGIFSSVHELQSGEGMPGISVYAAKFCRDKKLSVPPVFPDYVRSILLGCSGNPSKSLAEGVDFCDNAGEHISEKNPNYCEMTAFYWIWKNALKNPEDYVGVYHYRRSLDISENDLKGMEKNGVDVVLPYPLIHLPDIREHHTRYVKEEDWEAALAALQEIHPEYADRYEEIFSQPYFYNYNLILAKERVFADYCAWLFPVLFRTEELSKPKGKERRDRYLAYMSESLFTFYFLHHQNDLNIRHTGRRMFV